MHGLAANRGAPERIPSFPPFAIFDQAPCRADRGIKLAFVVHMGGQSYDILVGAVGSPATQSSQPIALFLLAGVHVDTLVRDNESLECHRVSRAPFPGELAIAMICQNEVFGALWSFFLETE